MKPQTLLPVIAFILSTTCAGGPALAEARLQEFKGYEPPPMFGSAPVPQARPAAPKVQMPATPKAEDMLNFPVVNTDIVTKQRVKAPEEDVALARPDYSDSHTLLKVAPDKEQIEQKPVKKTSAKKASAKKESKPAERKVRTAATPPVEQASSSKYIPASSPTMPAVPSVDVEKAKLDPFSLPSPAPEKDQLSGKPTPGERLMDQALNRHMVDARKKDVQTAISGDKVEKDAPLVTAALTKADSSPKMEILSLEYLPKMTELQSDQRTTLKTEIIPRLNQKQNERLQIHAYAEGAETGSDARRVSLARALALRAYLLENGVDPSRIDVRALGNNTTETPIDRVDLVFR
jgi:outer membrane protein OmpA-like peptidoglycan-associated protein